MNINDNQRAIYIGRRFSDKLGLTGYFSPASRTFIPDDEEIDIFETQEKFLYFSSSFNQSGQIQKWYTRNLVY